MINYNDGYFNLGTLFRAHGSATYKAVSFAVASTGVYLLLYCYGAAFDGPYGATGDGLEQYDLLIHPYPFAVIVSAVLFVLSAKVNYSYNRFWEACNALHNMHAKWLDVGSTVAAFHMQSKEFDGIRPPSFGDHPHAAGNLVLERSKDLEVSDVSIFKKALSVKHEMDLIEAPTLDSDISSPVPPVGKHLNTKGHDERSTRTMARMTELVSDESSLSAARNWTSNHVEHLDVKKNAGRQYERVTSVRSSRSAGGLPFPEYKSQSYGMNDRPQTAGAGSRMRIREPQNQAPTLFMQEAAHLVSLLSAVALSTLRCGDSNDMSMVEFVPGRHWPNYNSENDADTTKYGHKRNGIMNTIRYMLDVERTQRNRSALDAARPIPVIGGVSDREALLLQRARGASAKTALVFLWLQEFVMREQIHGSFGGVAPPIFSRVPQYLSDGHMWYNAARKVSYVPFPFPHAQMATAFVALSVVLMPTLMLSKAEMWFGMVLNFLTVLLFAGLNELSKELENPFRSVPNDLPLNLFQAHFNEALVTTFAGFHPDSWWEIDGDA